MATLAPSLFPCRTKADVAPYLRAALLFYVLATGLGLLLRAALVWPVGGLNFGHALHAHSHTLYFGWVALALFALGFEAVGARGAAVARVLRTVVVLSAATFGAFLTSGYGGPGIAVSAAALLVWTWAAWTWARAARGQAGLAVAHLRVAMAYLLLALGGALVRVGLLAAKVQDPLPGKLAVYAFLHLFSWFFLFSLAGLLLSRAPALGLRVDGARARRVLRVLAASAWITFPLGVLGGDAGVLGALARLGALVVAPAVGAWAVGLWRAATPALGAVRWGVRAVAAWLLLAALMQAVGAAGGATLAVSLRHPLILYLHALLVGVVTGTLLLLVCARLGRVSGVGLALHHGGLAVMAAGLALTSGVALVPALGPFARAGLVLAVWGGAGIVLGGVVCAWRARPRPSPSAVSVALQVAEAPQLAA